MVRAEVWGMRARVRGVLYTLHCMFYADLVWFIHSLCVIYVAAAAAIQILAEIRPKMPSRAYPFDFAPCLAFSTSLFYTPHTPTPIMASVLHLHRIL